MLLSNATYSAFRLYIFFSMCVPWELNLRPFALLMQCSTTEPQEHRCVWVPEGGPTKSHKDRTILPYCTLQFLPFISIGVNHLYISIVFVLNKTVTKKY